MAPFSIGTNKNRKNRHNWRFFLFLFGLALLLIGCVPMNDPETSQVQQGQVVFTLPADGSSWAGQTFTSRRGGLKNFTVTIEVVDQQEAELYAELLPENAETSGAGYWQKVHTGPVTFNFEVQPSPGNFRIRLTARGAAINLKGAADDFYPYGSAVSGSAADEKIISLTGDLTFSTGYDYNPGEAWQDVQSGFAQAWLAFPLAAVLLLPGAFLLVLFRWDHGLDLGEWLAYASGLSLAGLPVLMLWTGLARLPWSSGSVRIAAVLCLCAVSALTWKRKLWLNWKFDKLDLGFLAVFFGSLVLRLVMIRDMAGPAWVDGIHHALITRLMLAQGSLPQSFAPFFDLTPTDYHPGYHVGLAAFTWLSGSNLMQAMLVYGQFLNALAVPAVYLFTKSLTRSRSAALAAALFCGFCTPMPAYYTSWSRYTQLAGLLVFPVILAGINRVLGKDSAASKISVAAGPGRKLLSAIWQTVPIWVAAAGLVLVHYRVAAFCALLMLAWFGFQTWQDAELSIPWRRSIGLALVSAFFAGLAALPWLLPLVSQTILKQKTASTPPVWFNDFSWHYLTTGLGQPVMALAAMSIVFGLLAQKRFTWVLLAWIASLVVLANPGPIGLPPVFSNNITMEITLFLPICALAGDAVSLSIEAAAGLGWRWYRFALPSMALVVAFLGAQQIMPILNEGTMLVRQADIPALAWAGNNLPENSLVATNPFLWGYGSYAGADGGYWLAPGSGIRSIPLPVAANASMAGYAENNRVSLALTQFGNNPEQLAKLLRKEGIAYVFSGQRGGPISPTALAASPAFKTLYHQDSVWIFYITP